jgi:hypothetical protein
MDKLEDRLKDLILYVNQNSKFDIYAVELEYYKHAEFEIMIPKLFGNEVKKDIPTQQSNRWSDSTEDDFFEFTRTLPQSGIITQNLSKSVLELADIFRKLAKIANGSVWYSKIQNSSRGDYQKQGINDANSVVINLDSDSAMGFWVKNKQGPLIDFINDILEGLIEEGMLGRTPESRSYGRWFINLRSSSDKEIDKFIEICRNSLYKLTN